MRSDKIKKGPSRAPARAMLKGAGFTDADLERPLVGIANTWTEVTPCNVHLRALAEHVKAGVRAAGGTPIEFNTIAVSDGITMGTEGMRGSLVSREVIADSIELFVMSHMLDGVVALSGCDKTIPATVMALARLDVPGLVLYGGPIAPGRFEGKDVTIQDVFEAVGAHAAGAMSSQRLRVLEDKRVSRRGRVRRAVHGEHDARRARRCSASRRWARTRSRRRIRAKDDVARECGALVMELIARGRAAALAAHACGVRERDRLGRGDGGLDERACSTCSRSRTRPACRSRSTTSTRSRRARRCSPTSSRAAATPPST